MPESDRHQTGKKNKQSQPPGNQSDKPEKMRRTLSETAQKHDRSEIEQPTPNPPETELAFPGSPGMMSDGNLGDSESVPPRQHGDESVHPAVQFNAIENLSPVTFQSTVEIV